MTSGLNRAWRDEGIPGASALAILLSGAIAFCVLFVFRYAVLARTNQLFPQMRPTALKTFLAAGYNFGGDALAVGCVILACLLIARFAPRTGLIVATIVLGVMLVMGAANVPIAYLFGQPATLNLIRFAGLTDLGGVPTVMSYAKPGDLLLLGVALAGIVAMLVGQRLVSRLRLSQPLTTRLVGAALALAVAVPAVPHLVRGSEVRMANANAMWWLAQSLAVPRKSITWVDEPDFADPFATFVGSQDPMAPPGFEPLKNVVFVVLESVGAAYVDLERNPKLTPNMASMLPHMGYFPTAYSAMPSSEVSFFTLISGAYPAPSSNYMGRRGDALRMPTVLEAARGAGLRTAVFASATWGYTNVGRFARNNGVDHFEGPNDRTCPDQAEAALVRTETSDECTLASLERWIAADDRPFAALIWTDSTHYPYLGVGRHADLKTRDDDPAAAKARYLRQVAETDKLVGRLVDWLDARGDLDETLIVVIGDHGEAFGQHGTLVHGNAIYEEDMTVPLMFVNRRIFSGSVDRTPVRMIDAAPTVLSALGIAAPATFQGVDLLGTARPRRAFFVVPWSTLAVGYREGTRKYVYQWTDGKLTAYDLASDPGELSPRQLPADARSRVEWRIANWATVATRRLEEVSARSSASNR